MFINSALKSLEGPPKPSKYQEVFHIPVRQAKYCIDCETIHNGEVCPSCTSRVYLRIDRILSNVTNTR